ncbi:natural killer cell receptor 2B4 [Lycaon pictus]
MLGQALALTLLLLLQGHRGQGSAERVVGLSGQQLFLQPLGVPTKHINSAQWKVKWYLASEFSVILTWKNGSDVKYLPQTSNHFDSKLSFTTENLALLIKAVRLNHSGCYNLEVTDENGKVDNHYFQVSIFDHIEMPQILKEWRVLEGDTCQLFLSCSVSSSGNVSYAWYRGSELIQTEMNLTRSEEQVVNDSYIYTCNVSNPVSSANHTLRLTQGCPTASKQDNFVYFLVIVGICLLILFLVTLTCFCVWRRKKRQSAACRGEPLTVYEDVNHVHMGRNQEQNQNPPGEGSTIYSVIQSQSSAPTSQENKSLYALVQPSRKSESKKNQSSSFSHTIYEEVGKRQLKAQNPARLSRKELENFCIYS